MTIVSGIGIATGWQELSGSVPPPPACNYCLNFFQYPDVAGYPSYHFQSFYMDAAATVPAFSPVLNDAINGEGGLRALLQSMGGDVAGVYQSPTFVWNYLLYYQGGPVSIPLYDSLGNVAYTLVFSKFEDYGYPCTDNNNYCVQFSNTYNVLSRFNASGGPLGIIDFYWGAFTDIYPYGANYLTLTDTIQMNKFIKMLYGPSAGYTLVDDGVNYNFTITNALFYGVPRIIPSNTFGTPYGDLDMYSC